MGVCARGAFKNLGPPTYFLLPLKLATSNLVYRLFFFQLCYHIMFVAHCTSIMFFLSRFYVSYLLKNFPTLPMGYLFPSPTPVAIRPAVQRHNPSCRRTKIH